MYIKKTFLIYLLCVLSFYSVAQNRQSSKGKSMYTRERFNYRAPRVHGQKAKIVCPIFENSKYPYHGIGLKFGDPFAVTYKFYANKNFSLVADFGKASSGLYNRYFREKFAEYIPSDTVTYLSHKVNTDLVGELKLLYQFNVDKISPGLQVYIGGGWEWKYTQLQYSYTADQSSTGGVQNEITHLYANRFTQGFQGIIGIEYAYFQLPISAFMEVEYFYDLLADPGWTKIEGGVGLRYIF